MKIYFPECYDDSINYVGYNNAVHLLKKTLGEYFTRSRYDAQYRMYCNLPWYHEPKKLKDGLPLIVYTMYEASVLPRLWKTFLNNHADLILVPSSFCKNVFIKSGVTKPIEILPLGIDTEKIKPVPKELNKDKYVFLWVGVALDYGGRKGVDCVIKAFRELKKEGRLRDDARLIVKFKPYDDLNFTLDHFEDHEGVIFIQRVLDTENMKHLYKSVDCCVNPTHGEGWGMIPLEQMAMGKPVILTNWSMDYINPRICFPVSYSLKESPITWNHQFFSFNINGFYYNIKGLPNKIKILPELRHPKPDGKNYHAVGLNADHIPFGQQILNRANNFVHKFQMKTGLYYDSRRKWKTLFQEYPGQDAHVKVDDLKAKMEWCYNHKYEAEDMGFLASEYVKRNWDCKDIKENFLTIIKNLKKGV